MLVEFSVGNWRSFLAPVTLSLQAAKLTTLDPQVDEDNTFEVSDLRLLRSAAIYGANASGKSNLIQALAYMRRFVLRSSKESQATEPTGAERYRLSTTTFGKPSYFQIVFLLGGKRYRYGFEVDEQRVSAEWLYRKAEREVRLFVRERDEYDISGSFKEGRGLEKRTRGNALFLSVAAQFNGPVATSILGWFGSHVGIISGLDDTYGGYTVSRCETDEAFRARVLDFVHEADLGIADLRVERQSLTEAPLPQQVRAAIMAISSRRLVTVSSGEPPAVADPWVRRVKTAHQVFDHEHFPVGFEAFDVDDQESAGTRKLLYLAGPLLDALERGMVLVIDEMEARLHPVISRAIVRLFNSPSANQRNAQLVFVTHDEGLLSSRLGLLRRDQVWFTEKDRFGATDLYSLAELRVRKDASFDKDYLAGRYGAIPFVGGLPSLFEEMPDAETAETERA